MGKGDKPLKKEDQRNVVDNLRRELGIKPGFETLGSHYLNWPITTQHRVLPSSIVIGQFKQCEPRVSNPESSSVMTGVDTSSAQRASTESNANGADLPEFREECATEDAETYVLNLV